MKFKTRAYRPRHKPGRMNNTEFEYSKHLELLKRIGEIVDYSFECETLKIGDDCRYTPDFRVIKSETIYIHELGTGDHTGFGAVMNPHTTQYIEFHEVKGTLRKKRTADSILSHNSHESKTSQNITKPFIEDDALVKIKAASELHPYKFILVWKGLNGQWERREIN